MLCIILFVFVMSLWRAPCVALMPDLTPSSLRSEGNAVINLMGGIGGALATGAATVVCFLGGWDKETDDALYIPWVFVFGAAVMVACTAVLFFVKEPDSRLKTVADERAFRDELAERTAKKEAEKEEKRQLKAIRLTKPERKSLVFMLIGLFFLFCGTNAVQTFFALFAAEVLKIKVGTAATMMIVFVLASAAAALPAGFAGKRLGRKKTILSGIVVIGGVFALYLAVQAFAKGTAFAAGATWAALFIAGAANMFITVNTLPLVLEIGGVKKIGTFTGYYYTATFSAQIATPIVYGLIRTVTGTYMTLFIYSPVCFLLALLSILMVRHGEAIPEDVLKRAMADEG
jgi:Na+/melibiose symporter-like transporter